MKLHSRRLAGVFAIASALALGSATQATAVSPVDDNYVDVDGVQVAQSLNAATAAELDAALTTGGVTVVMDSTTGDVLSVDKSPDITPMIAWTNVCYTGNFCLFAYSTPYSSVGFSGVGTSYGTWAGKGGYTTGNWNGQGWFRSPVTGLLIAGSRLGPNSTLLLTGPVTFTKVRIYY